MTLFWRNVVVVVGEGLLLLLLLLLLVVAAVVAAAAVVLVCVWGVCVCVGARARVEAKRSEQVTHPSLWYSMPRVITSVQHRPNDHLGNSLVIVISTF